jgi:hypothetical protein
LKVRETALAGVVLVAVAGFGACTSPAGGDTYNAWYRPVPLGWCPRYLVGDRHAWLVGKIAPTGERSDLRQRVFTFRGRFLTTDAGAELVRTSCDNRRYPVFELFEVVGERPMTDADAEPQVARGPGASDAGRAAVAADGGLKDSGTKLSGTSVVVPRVVKPSQRRRERRRERRRQRRRGAGRR